MNMHNKFTTKQIQDAVQTLDQPAKDLGDAKSRVWHKLANSTIQQPISMSQPQPRPSFWRNPLLLPMFTASVSIIVIIAAALVILGQVPNSTNLASNSSSSNNSLSGADRTLPGNIKTDGNKSTLDKFKTLAATRFQEITGTTYEKFEKIVEPITQAAAGEVRANAQNTNQVQNNSSVLPGAKVVQTQINSEKAAELAKQDINRNRNIFYNKVETISPKYDPYQVYNEGNKTLLPNTNQDLPMVKSINESWYTSDYNKFVTYEDSKITNLTLSTPEYYLSYAGGKFAIKNINAELNYFGGFSTSSDWSGSQSNYEVEFLKYLLSDKAIKDNGVVTIDGKQVRYLETPAVAPCGDPVTGATLPDSFLQSPVAPLVEPGSSTSDFRIDTLSSIGGGFGGAPCLGLFSTRYYVDESNFTLYLTESYTDNKLQYSTKVLDSKQYQDTDPNKLINTAEIANIPIREFRDVSMPAPGQALADFAKDYPILVTSEYVQNSVYAYKQSESSNLYNTRDFNPAISQEYEDSIKNRTSATVSSRYTDVNSSTFNNNIQVEFYKEKPDLTSFQFGISYKKSKDIQLSINNLPIDAELYDSEFSYQQLLFAYQNFWITISSFGNNNLDNLGFKTLTTTEIQELDALAKQIFDNTVVLSPDSLDSAQSNPIPLPGDILPKYQLKLQSVIKPSRSFDDCDRYITYTGDLNQCFVGKYDGVLLSFYTPYKFDTKSTTNGSINWSVLNKALSQQEIREVVNNMTDSLSKNSYDGNVNNRYTSNIEVSIEGYTKVLINQPGIEFNFPDQLQYQTFFFFTVDGKTVIIDGNYQTIAADGSFQTTDIANIFIDIAKNSALNKDLAILENQLDNKSNEVFTQAGN